MLSGFARLLLALTSLAPMMLVLAVVRFSSDRATEGFYLVAGTLFLMALCAAMLWWAARGLGPTTLTLKSIKNTDKDLLSFLLSYLLPLAAEGRTGYSPAVLLVVAAIVLGVVLRTEMYHVNPLLGLAGFHFYEASTTDGMGLILITREPIHHLRDSISAVQVSNHLFLQSLQ